jgi:thymidylate synthase (FAD)
MKIILPSYKIEYLKSGLEILHNIELYGRTCYKSEDMITETSAEKFIKMLIVRGHHSVIEHENMTVRFIIDRGVSHELVRHRLCAFSQESTRYCNYGHVGEITVIKPCFYKEGSREYETWQSACQVSEAAYNRLVEAGGKPEYARSVLPNSLKTEIVVTANLREWRHILTLRTAQAAHPQMREVMIPLLKELTERVAIIFDDIAAVVFPEGVRREA